MENWSTEAVVVLRTLVIQKKEYTKIRQDREEEKEVKDIQRREEKKTGKEEVINRGCIYPVVSLFLLVCLNTYILFLYGEQSCEIPTEALLRYFLLYVENCLQGNLDLVRALTQPLDSHYLLPSILQQQIRDPKQMSEKG